MLEEATHGCVRPQRSEQLDVGRTCPEQDLFHALILDPLPMRNVDAQRGPVLANRGVQIGHGDPNVVDVLQHRTEDRGIPGHSQVRARRRLPAWGGGCSRSIRWSASVRW